MRPSDKPELDKDMRTCLHSHEIMSCVMGKPVIGVSNQV